VGTQREKKGENCPSTTKKKKKKKKKKKTIKISHIEEKSKKGRRD